MIKIICISKKGEAHNFGDIVFEPELSFVLQDKSEESVPDAAITQPSFRLVIETKLTDWFY